MIDQECLAEKEKQWKEEQPNLRIFYRATTIAVTDPAENKIPEDVDDDDDTDVKLLTENGGNFLFVYQSAEQRRLLPRYGNEIACLDATYRTTRYTLPLFLLVVKTNVDYQVAGTFVSEIEDIESIEEALGIFKRWSPGLKPKFFMTDYGNEEIHAIESIFNGILSTYIKLKLVSFSVSASQYLCMVWAHFHPPQKELMLTSMFVSSGQESSESHTTRSSNSTMS